MMCVIVLVCLCAYLLHRNPTAFLCVCTMILLYRHLLKVDTFATSIGTGEDLHTTIVCITVSVVGYKRTDTELLQWMPTIVVA